MSVDFFEDGPGSSSSFNSKPSNQKGLDLFGYIYGKQNRDFKTKEIIKVKGPTK